MKERELYLKDKKGKKYIRPLKYHDYETWSEIDIEKFVKWLFQEGILRYNPAVDVKTFDLTPKGMFLFKFMGCYGGNYPDHKFSKFLDSAFDWKWLWKKAGIEK
jgi:hypothetical protein